MKSSERVKAYIPWMTIAAVIMLLPVIIPNPYVISMMVFVALYGVLAIGMGILSGAGWVVLPNAAYLVWPRGDMLQEYWQLGECYLPG